ncbi:MAG: hypothetical protein JOZ02_14920 [Acidobacteria bacterium]|nr:hypothetical protein [Acidobacteriota bacterium]
MHVRPTRLAAALVRLVCRAFLRVFIKALVFTLCLSAVLAYMGVKLPDPRELPDWLESVSQLARILH